MGGMAEVFVARREGMHGFAKKLALKRILPQFAQDADFVSMFITEARLAAQLDHPNIVHVFDFGEHDHQLFLAMEYIDGTHVNKLLRAVYLRGEVVPLDIALHIASQTARALSHAHRACDENGVSLGIVHRDVSPANILITRTGHVKLSDFGIAHVAHKERDNTQVGRVRGKLGYMSPEQIMGKPLDGRSDVFVLATVLAEMLMAAPLFGEGSEMDILLRIRNADLRALETCPRQIPLNVKNLLQRALSKNRHDRPHASEFADAIDHIIYRRRVSSITSDKGAQALAKLIQRLDLVSLRPSDASAEESGARPSWLLRLDDARTSHPGAETHPHVPLATASLQPNAVLASSSPAYWVKAQNGTMLGPVAAQELVKLAVMGVIDRHAQVSHDLTQFRSILEVDALERVFATPALQWGDELKLTPTLKGEAHPLELISTAYALATEQETGMLYLFDGERQKKVYFVDGAPDFIASTDPNELLGQYLIRNGYCESQDVDRALANLPAYGGRLGDALIARGCLRPAQLFKVVSSQMHERYLEVFRWGTGTWRYVRGAQSQEETFPIPNNPFILLRAAVDALDSTALTSNLSAYSEATLLPCEENPNRAMFQMPETWNKTLTCAQPGQKFSQWVEQAAQQVDFYDVLKAAHLGIGCKLISLS